MALKRTKKKAEEPRQKKKYKKRLPGGRGLGGSLYLPDSHPERAFKLSLLGLTNKELAIAFGVHIDTISKWQQTYPEFDKAIQDGRTGAVSEVAYSLYRAACGYSHPASKWVKGKKGKLQRVDYIKHFTPNATAAIYLLNNKTRHLDNPFSNKQSIEVTGQDGGPIELKATQIDTDGLGVEEVEKLIELGVKLLDKNKEQE